MTVKLIRSFKYGGFEKYSAIVDLINSMKTKESGNKLEIIEEILSEIEELEVDQHPNFFKNEPNGRKRMADLLVKLNLIEKI